MMSYRGNINFRFGGPLTDTVKKLMIINGAIFIIQKLFNIFSPGIMDRIFGLHHIGLIYEFKIWQLFTYMFLHGGFLHILFNLLGLWMFGGELEQKWGKKTFLQYYLFSGFGAGIFIAIMNYIVFSKYGFSPVTIGASGAIYGILLAYGLTWPNREVLLYFLFPVKIKYLVLGFGIIEFIGTLSSAMGAGGTISHIGHLGGIGSGFLFLFFRKKRQQTVSYMYTTGKPNSSEGIVKHFLKEERLKRKSQEIEKRIKAKKIIDTLLEKIAKEGMSSLSHKEKSDLEWARKHYYPNDEDTVH
ncbi:MAG: rhomboid family intramembrane serine protease [Spirochaetes bacterium]|nr:rhomboid family intramembrane serine protease [Spirochaetota bacterium]